MKRLILYILCVLCSLVSHGEPVNSIEVRNDSSDFITASLLIMQPDQSQPVSYFGHTALRLQCPSAGLDYCFTFDAFSSGDYWKMITGHERTTLLPVESGEFFKDYAAHHRKVYEHELNLTLEEERQLWQAVDRLVDMGDYMQTDYVNHGCAAESASLITSVIRGKLSYPSTIQRLGDTQAEIIGKYLTDDTWMQLACYIFASDDVHRPLADNNDKLMLPTVLEMIWKETTITDESGCLRPLFADKDMIVHQAPVLPSIPQTPIGPELATTILLIVVVLLSVVEIIQGRIRYLSAIVDGILLTIQSGIGFILLTLLLYSTLATTGGWNCNIITFNPIPLIVWLISLCIPFGERTRIAVHSVYTLTLAAFLVYMSIHPLFFDRPQVYLVITLAVRSLSYVIRDTIRIFKDSDK